MRISIDNVPQELKRRFKSYCASIDVTMGSAIMHLLELELEEQRLAKQQLNRL